MRHLFSWLNAKQNSLLLPLIVASQVCSLFCQLQAQDKITSDFTAVRKIIDNYTLAIEAELSRQMQASKEGLDNKDYAHIPEFGFSTDYVELEDASTSINDFEDFLKTGDLLSRRAAKIYEDVYYMEKNNDFSDLKKNVAWIVTKLSKHEEKYGPDPANWSHYARKDLLDSFEKLMVFYWHKKKINENVIEGFKESASSLGLTGATVFALTRMLSPESLSFSGVVSFVLATSSYLIFVEVMSHAIDSIVSDRHDKVFLESLRTRGKKPKAPEAELNAKRRSLASDMGGDVMDASDAVSGCKNALRLSRAILRH